MGQPWTVVTCCEVAGAKSSDCTGLLDVVYPSARFELHRLSLKSGEKRFFEFVQKLHINLLTCNCNIPQSSTSSPLVTIGHHWSPLVTIGHQFTVPLPDRVPQVPTKAPRPPPDRPPLPRIGPTAPSAPARQKTLTLRLGSCRT